MARRLISTSRSEIRAMSAAELKESIRDSEGRVVLCQNYVGLHPLVDGSTNAELAQAFGADMIFFNGYSMTPGASQPGLQVEQWENGSLVQKSYRLKDMKALIHVPLGSIWNVGPMMCTPLPHPGRIWSGRIGWLRMRTSVGFWRNRQISLFLPETPAAGPPSGMWWPAPAG
mgnify:CR=1 FL=1